MGRCLLCKHWKRGYWYVYAPDFKVYSHAAGGMVLFPKAGIKEWKKTGDDTPRGQSAGTDSNSRSLGTCQPITSDDDEEDKDARAVCNSEGIGGELETKPRFGCTLFEPFTSAAEQEDTVPFG